MKIEPLIFSLGVDDFDLTKLPINEDLLRSDRNLLESAIHEFYISQFRQLGGDGDISISNGVISVKWMPESGLSDIIEYSISLLKQGDYGTSVPLLKAVLKHSPDDPVVLYNLGMALSDLNQLDDAIKMLNHLIELQADNARAWNALGVAYSRINDMISAEKSLQISLTIDPKDGYACRNLGAIIAKRSKEEAIPFFKRAADLLPEDQASQYGYGLALLETGDSNSADTILKKAVELNPMTPIAEMARSKRSQIAHETMRSKVGGGLRMDVVMYCLSALERFRDQPELLQPVTFEIAMLGRQGLDMNNPEKRYTLKSLPGDFSGLQLVTYMYVGLKQLSLEADPGIDLSQEYEHAKQLFNQDNS